jgi:hypothetical protein
LFSRQHSVCMSEPVCTKPILNRSGPKSAPVLKIFLGTKSCRKFFQVVLIRNRFGSEFSAIFNRRSFGESKCDLARFSKNRIRLSSAILHLNTFFISRAFLCDPSKTVDKKRLCMKQCGAGPARHWHALPGCQNLPDLAIVSNKICVSGFRPLNRLFLLHFRLPDFD